MVGADIIGPYTPSSSQHQYILLFQDFLTRWIEVVPLRKTTGPAITKAFKDVVINRWGTPSFLFSDNGTEFSNKAVEGHCAAYKIRISKTPKYHPRRTPWRG